MSAPRIAVVGTGAVARALASAYVSRGNAVVCIVSRDAGRGRAAAAACGVPAATCDPAQALDADVVVVAVADGALASVGARFAELDSDGALFLHTSGALEGAALGGGLRAGSLHPLQTFTGDDVERLASRVPGTHWFHEGEGREEAKALVAGLGGTFHALAPGGKTLYHAGAAVLSNHTVALYDTSVRLFRAAGVAPRDAHGPLQHLLAGTLANLRDSGLPEALTGPVARGDLDTVRAHVEALRSHAPGLLPSYCALALRAIPLGVAKGTLDPDAAAELDTILRGRPSI